MIRKFFNLTTVAAGVATAMIVAGDLALVAGTYTRPVVHDQLVPQKIFFPKEKSQLPDSLHKHAGAQVDTAQEARAHADEYIALHLREIGHGRTYSEVSEEFLKNLSDKKLATMRQTLFMAEHSVECS